MLGKIKYAFIIIFLVSIPLFLHAQPLASMIYRINPFRTDINSKLNYIWLLEECNGDPTNDTVRSVAPLKINMGTKTDLPRYTSTGLYGNPVKHRAGL